ncbi:MAG: RDD family protein [Candidatus Latescibacteria bacterium]|jgi:uncharacterized RDD family membrane protein YckC|nr:RDD family protein [Candidatus Latescibacterota bacterium]
MLMQSEIAGVGRRLLATVLDVIILHLALSVVTRNMLLSPAGIWVVDFIIAVVYSAMFLGLKGQTPGKMVLGLRVIDVNGGALDYVQTFRRSIIKWLPVFGLFVVMALVVPEELQKRPASGEMIDTVEIDAQSATLSSVVMVVGTIGWLVLIHLARRHPDGQGMHDRVAGTFVIKAG